ncbi:hypothetical protein XELAEV_18047544mg [Xenopus laevis]|uniref:Uncharacterized protein n=1 Tax=Xenopus laevis TaxID=8355 RepID=A0A974H1N1_XENLA|nr:hypothetical protein XELAEV_18047544mg [Xenopus laevis]
MYYIFKTCLKITFFWCKITAFLTFDKIHCSVVHCVFYFKFISFISFHPLDLWARKLRIVPELCQADSCIFFQNGQREL